MLEIIRVLVFATYFSLVFGAGIIGNDKYPMENGHHVIDNGKRQTGDEVLYSETLLEPGKPLRHIGNEYCYPAFGSTDRVKISEYEIKDLDGGNNGGLAFDVSGGVGQNQVCFFLKTQYGKGYRFKVDIYGFRQGGVQNNIPINGGPGYGGQGTPPFGMGSGPGSNLGSGFGNHFGTASGGNNFQPGGLAGGFGGPGTGIIGQPGIFGGSYRGNFGQSGNFGGISTGYNFPQPGDLGGPGSGSLGGPGMGNFAQPGNYGNVQFPQAGYSGTTPNYGGPNAGNFGPAGNFGAPTGSGAGFGSYGSTAGGYGSVPDQFGNGNNALGGQSSSGTTVQSQNYPFGTPTSVGSQKSLSSSL